MWKKFNLFVLVLLFLSQTILGPISVSAQPLVQEESEEVDTDLIEPEVNQTLLDATTAVEKVESSVADFEAVLAFIQEAGILVNALEDSEEKNALQEKLHALHLQIATNAVDLAVESKAELEITRAYTFVNELTDGIEKDALSDRLVELEASLAPEEAPDGEEEIEDVEQEEEVDGTEKDEEVKDEEVEEGAEEEINEALQAAIQAVDDLKSAVETLQAAEEKTEEAYSEVLGLYDTVKAVVEALPDTEGETGKAELQQALALLASDLDELKEQLTPTESPDKEQKFHLQIGEVTDLNGVVYDEDHPLGVNDEFKLKMNWTLENQHSYTAGETIQFNLPKEISFGPMKDPIELRDPSSALVATAIVDNNKVVHLTFTDYVENSSNVSGWMEIIAMLDKDQTEEEDGKVTISPIGEENELEIPIDMQDRKKTIEKQGQPNKGYNADEIKWTVTMNKDRLSLEDAKIIDKLPTGTEFKTGSLIVKKQKTSLNGDVLGEETIIGIIPEYDAGNNEITVNLGNINERYVVEYVTVITDEDATTFKNNATLHDAQLEDLAANATITVNRGKPIKKSVVNNYNPKTGVIEWAIEFNYNMKDLQSVTLTDKWESKVPLALVDGSLKFQEMTINAEGQASPVGEAMDLPSGSELVTADDGFSVKNITTDKAYLITYETEVTERVLENFTVQNTAGFGSETTGKIDAPVGQYYGSKSAGTIDYNKKTIDWKIEINHDEYPMEKISLKDTLGNGLTLLPDTIKITVDGAEYKGDFELDDGNPFEIKFPENFKTDKKIEVTYQTRYIADLLDKENGHSIAKNQVAITWTPKGSDTSITKGVAASKPLNKDTTNNSWKNGTYDPSTKEITWTIYTNYRENRLANLMVEDTLGQNQKLVEGSVTVTELSIAGNGAITEGTSKPVTPTVNGNAFTVGIGHTDRAHKIEYKTSLAGLEDIQKEYTNSAVISDGDTEIGKVDAKVGVYGDRKYGNKSGQQDGKQVHWSIDVNMAQEKIAGLQLVDTISENQEYLTDTIKVYEVAYVNGKRTKGKAFTDYSLVVQGNKFTIKWDETVERSFIVDYSTLFFAGHGEKVDNAYQITGESITASDDDANGSQNVMIKQLASGGGVGTAGYLIVDKKDTTYGQEEGPLAGAVFELIDADTGKTLKTGTTDENGKIDFGRLLFGEYILKESVIPNGYIAQIPEQAITIDQAYLPDEVKQVYTFENYQPVFMIEITKTDGVDGSFLEGAKFEVYDTETGDNKVGGGTTDENGKLLIEGLLKAGTYYVQEVASPTNYEPDHTRFPVTIGEKEQFPVQLEIQNRLYPGKGKLQKVDADNPKVNLANAIFEVYEDGKLVNDSAFKTDANGVGITRELPPGNYTVREKTAPTGYVTSDVEYTLVIPRANEIGEYPIKLDDELKPVENKVKTTSIQLTKADSISGAKLADAEFKIEQTSGNYAFTSATETTDKNGVLTFTDLKPGIYEITETKAPAGYIQLSEPIIVEVTYEDVHKGTIKQLANEVKNAPLAQLIVEKKDSESGVVLKGAQFKLTKDGADFRTGLTTNADGKIVLTGLPAGDYALIETKAPAGYKLNGTPQVLTVDGRNTETATIHKTVQNDIFKGSVSFEKIDGDTNQPLAGVEFTLSLISPPGFINGGDLTFEPITKATDANGKLTFDDLRPGRYSLKETKPTEGYQPYWQDLDFNIKLVEGGHDYVIPYAIKNYKRVDVPVTKVWEDNHDATGDRPEKIDVQLFRSDNTVTSFKTVEIKDDNGQWAHTFKGLDAVDAKGNPYTYTIKESPVPGYQTKIDQFNITNTRSEKVDVEGTKTWKDDDSSARPNEITVKLFANGIEKDSVPVTAETDWQYAFKDLDGYDQNGVAIAYSIKELSVPGYETVVNGYDITNIRTGTTAVEGTKTWLDDDAKERPEKITVNLLQNNEVIDSQDVTKASNWQFSFAGLPQYDEEGKLYTYQIEEIEVEGYKTINDGFDVTNLRVGKTAVEGTKTWLDDDSAERPTEITVKLLANGVETGKTTIVNADSDWMYQFTDLDQFDDQGKEIVYTVDEVAVDGYKKMIKGFDITNIRTGTTMVEGTKTWIGDTEYNRPASITVNLLRNGKVVDSKKVTKDDDWAFIFEDLEMYDEEGVLYEYTVTEKHVPGYRATIDGYDITNKRIPGGGGWIPPTDPDPEEPEEPGKPGEPDPEEPEEPGKPGEPNPEEPEEPGKPGEPDPEEPEEPGKPGEPDPEEPEEPGKPGEPDPEEPEEPGKPGDPDPEEPEEPGKPGDPDPEEPGEPGKPGEPNPEKPEEPGKPGGAEKPVNPNKPGNGDSSTPGGKKPVNGESSKVPTGNKLPQTGEESFRYMIALGVLFIIGGGTILMRQRKKHN